jgi:hypothetical protein
MGLSDINKLSATLNNNYCSMSAEHHINRLLASGQQSSGMGNTVLTGTGSTSGKSSNCGAKRSKTSHHVNRWRAETNQL